MNPLFILDYSWQNGEISDIQVPVYFIESGAQFESIAFSWMDKSVLAIDTEFERRTTFYAGLALVQVYDGESIFLVDPHKTECVASAKSVFESPDIIKVLHSSKEDLEVLYTAWNIRLQALFDTQVAFSFLRHELSIGYANLVKQLSGNELDKEATTSDWNKRPLTSQQLNYAAIDVLFLIDIYEKLSQEMNDKSYARFFEAECNEYCSTAIEKIESLADYTLAKEVWRLKENDLSLFKRLFLWREQTARQENRTKNHIIKDQEMVCMALTKPESINQIKTISGIHPRSIRLYANEWLNIVEDWSNSPKESLQLIPNPRDVAQLKELVKELGNKINLIAKNNHIPATLLLSKRLIRKLSFAILTGTSKPSQWSGWRKEILAASVDETSKAIVSH